MTTLRAIRDFHENEAQNCNGEEREFHVDATRMMYILAEATDAVDPSGPVEQAAPGLIIQAGLAALGWSGSDLQVERVLGRLYDAWDEGPPENPEVTIQLDLVSPTGPMIEDWKTITLPGLPTTGEALNLDEQPYQFVGRIWGSHGGAGSVRYAVTRLSTGGLVTAPASALQGLSLGGRQ